MIKAILLTYGGEEADWATVSSLYCALSPGRRSKACVIRDPAAFKTSVIAGRLLEKHLSLLTGLEARDLSYSYGDGGRPRISFSDTVDFNISHTEGAVLAVFKLFDGGEASLIPCLGCDIERTPGRFKRPGMPESIVERFFAANEKKLFSELLLEKGQPRARDAEELFFRFWTAKEAYGKMTGKGLRDTLGHETVVLKGGVPAYADGTVLIPGEYEDLIMTVAADSRLKDGQIIFTRETVAELL